MKTLKEFKMELFEARTIAKIATGANKDEFLALVETKLDNNRGMGIEFILKSNKNVKLDLNAAKTLAILLIKWAREQ